jgi:hypothetical protein
LPVPNVHQDAGLCGPRGFTGPAPHHRKFVKSPQPSAPVSREWTPSRQSHSSGSCGSGNVRRSPSNPSANARTPPRNRRGSSSSRSRG